MSCMSFEPAFWIQVAYSLAYFFPRINITGPNPNWVLRVPLYVGRHVTQIRYRVKWSRLLAIFLIVVPKPDASIFLLQGPSKGRPTAHSNLMTAGEALEATNYWKSTVLLRKHPAIHHGDMFSSGKVSLRNERLCHCLKLNNTCMPWLPSQTIPRFPSAFHCGQSLEVHVVNYICLGKHSIRLHPWRFRWSHTGTLANIQSFSFICSLPCSDRTFLAW
jgi:hypothetical protein